MEPQSVSCSTSACSFCTSTAKECLSNRRSESQVSVLQFFIVVMTLLWPIFVSFSLPSCVFVYVCGAGVWLDSPVGRAADWWSEGCRFTYRQEERESLMFRVIFLCWLLFSVCSTLYFCSATSKILSAEIVTHGLVHVSWSPLETKVQIGNDFFNLSPKSLQVEKNVCVCVCVCGCVCVCVCVCACLIVSICACKSL